MTKTTAKNIATKAAITHTSTRKVIRLKVYLSTSIIKEVATASTVAGTSAAYQTDLVRKVSQALLTTFGSNSTLEITKWSKLVSVFTAQAEASYQQVTVQKKITDKLQERVSEVAQLSMELNKAKELYTHYLKQRNTANEEAQALQTRLIWAEESIHFASDARMLRNQVAQLSNRIREMENASTTNKDSYRPPTPE